MRTMTCLMGVRVCPSSWAWTEVASGPPRLSCSTVKATKPWRRPCSDFETNCLKDMQSPLFSKMDSGLSWAERHCAACVTGRLLENEMRKTSRANFARFLALRARRNCNFGVADAAVVISEKGGGLGSDDRGFKIGSSESTNGFERAPGGLDENLSFACVVANGDVCSKIAGYAAKLRQDVLGKVLEILWQLRFCSASGPVPKDGPRGAHGHSRGSVLFLANDYFPGAHFPLFDEAIYNVGILAGEVFNFALVIHAKNQQGAVHG